MAKATFKPTLSAYPTMTFREGQTTGNINPVIENFQEIDLTKLHEKTNFRITEDEITGKYVITVG